MNAQAVSLVVFFLVDGAWVRGDSLDHSGWAPRAYETRAICETRMAFAQKAIEQSRAAGRKMADSRWFCIEGDFPETMPEGGE